MIRDSLSNNIQKDRPSVVLYPEKLFRYLVGSCRRHELAWAVETINGQAIQELAKYFKIVHATNANSKQVHSLAPSPNVVYAIAREQYPKLKKSSVDIVCVTQAIYELDKDMLYKEVSRVLKKYGVFSYWVYGIPRVNPELDELVRVLLEEMKNFSKQIKRRQLERNCFRLTFPFKETITPSFEIRVEWDFQQYLVYLRKWLCLSKISEHQGQIFLDERIDNFYEAWNLNEETRTIVFPIEMKMGIKT